LGLQAIKLLPSRSEYACGCDTLVAHSVGAENREECAPLCAQGDKASSAEAVRVAAAFYHPGGPVLVDPDGGSSG
jgi:hypothetical protein